jgi:hypothetical protein
VYIYTQILTVTSPRCVPRILFCSGLGDEFDFFKDVIDDCDNDYDEDFDVFADVLDHSKEAAGSDRIKRLKLELGSVEGASCVGIGKQNWGGDVMFDSDSVQQGNPNPGGARVSDSGRLLEIRSEFRKDMGHKCDICSRPGRLYKTSCRYDKKCRQRVLAYAFDSDVDRMEGCAVLARRQFQGTERKVQVRSVLGVGNRENPKKRIMQVEGVDVCLSFWVWWWGFAKGMISDVFGEIKGKKAIKGDLRLVPAVKEWTIKLGVVKWMKVAVNELTQDCPEHLEGDTETEARKFLSGITVRGCLHELYLLDLAEDGTGEMLFCAKGYFSSIFQSQYGRKTGPATGNFWATDRVSSLMGGYCLTCSDTSLKVASQDALTRMEGKKEKSSHVKKVWALRKLLDAHAEKAKHGDAFVEGDDAATSSGTALPILQKIAQKFVTNRVPFKIIECVMFNLHDHPYFCRRVVVAPWVQPTGNLQVHAQLYCTLPAFAKYYLYKKEPCPTEYIRWSDGGGDTFNITTIALGYFMVKEGVFEDVYLNRPMVYHSHGVWDRMVAIQQKHFRFSPGTGAITFELLMKHIREIPNGDAVYVDQTFDLTTYLSSCIFKKFKHYREALSFWFHRESDGSVTVKCSMNPADVEFKYELVAEGDGAKCFFETQPEGTPSHAAHWHTERERAVALRKSFISSIKSVSKETSELPIAFLTKHKHGSSREARERIKTSWEAYGDIAPGATGELPEQATEVVWPPPCFDAIKRSRIGTTRHVPATTPTVAGGGGRAAGNRVTSRDEAVNQTHAFTNLRDYTILKQPSVESSKFYIVMCDEEPKLWLAEVSDIVARRGVATKGRLLPSSLRGDDYWEHEPHTSSCGLCGEGLWGDARLPAMCGERCKSSGTVNVRFYYPQLSVAEKEPGAALTWAGSMVSSISQDIEVPPQPEYVTAHWAKKVREPSSNLVLGNVGPEVKVSVSNGGKKIRLLVASQSIYIATAVQLFEADHPLFV